MKRHVAFSIASTVTLCFVAPVEALQFNFIPEPGTSQEAIDGFAAAGALWSAVLNDDMSVNISIGFRPLETGILGSTGSERVRHSLSDYVSALDQDASTALDTDAMTRLLPRSDIPLMINLTSDSPHGSGSANPYLDDDGSNNNTMVSMTRATAKALALLNPQDPAPDASISFNSDFNWDFVPEDGIDPNSFSYIAVAAHEIGHALGFVSGVDILDGNSPPESSPFASNEFVFVNPADLFRFSDLSRTNGNAIDWTADPRQKSFAASSTHADEAQFSLGQRRGDGRQASHWKDNLGIGLMDPTAAPGENGQITVQDKRLFDAIGYDVGTGNEIPVLCKIAELELPDAGPAIESVFDPEDGSLVTDLQVSLQITHSWVGDLEVRLTAPDGTSALIIDRPGRGETGFGCGGNDIDARLTDAAADPAENACASTDVALVGELSPAEPFALFRGVALSGNWTLSVRDHATQDSGELASWCLSPRPLLTIANAD